MLWIVCGAQLLLAIYDTVTHHELVGLVFFSCIIFCVLMALLVAYVCSQADALAKQDKIIYLLTQIERSTYQTEIVVTQMWAESQKQAQETKTNDQ
jgi:uncharacterized membrane protein